MTADPEAGLLAAALAAPDDDAPRLIYADWLLERGDPRGELIAVRCELARHRSRLPSGRRFRALLTVRR